MRHVEAPLSFIPPKFNPFVLHCLRGALPVLMRVRTRSWLTAKIARVEAENLDILADLYRQFQTGQARVLIAFRHPEVDDPLPMLYVLSRLLPQVARQQGISLKRPLHAHFVYDRGMPLWGGQWLGWLLSRLGGIPVRRGRRLDLSAMRVIRHLLMHGSFPMAIAPEGANNGSSDRIGPLERGLAQLAVWCLQDLRAAGRTERVAILPVGIQYRYLTPPWARLAQLIGHLEWQWGIPEPKQRRSSSQRVDPLDLAQRLNRLQAQFVACLNEHYRQFYPNAYNQARAIDLDTNLDSPQWNDRSTRSDLVLLLDTALRVGEQAFGIPSKGSLVYRCRQMEEAGWQRIYRHVATGARGFGQSRKALAKWVMADTELHMRHMRLVESLVALTEAPTSPTPTVEELSERALLLFDAGERTRGKGLPTRPQLGWRRVKIRIGHPLWIGEDGPVGSHDHRGSRERVERLTQTLKLSMESLLH